MQQRDRKGGWQGEGEGEGGGTHKLSCRSHERPLNSTPFKVGAEHAGFSPDEACNHEVITPYVYFVVSNPFSSCDSLIVINLDLELVILERHSTPFYMSRRTLCV